MIYAQVAVYDMEANFVGYAIHKQGLLKLQSGNLWAEEERPALQEQLDRLNGDVKIRRQWPRSDDPEVQALLNDPTWMPLETHVTDVIDDENSYYVWTEADENGKPTQASELDEQASVIAYKKARVPVRPVDAQVRTKAAHETVARRRAGLERV